MTSKYYLKWSNEEKEFLIKNAGSLSLEKIAKKLGRPFNSVVNKADELGVADGKMCTHLYTANQFAKIMGVAASTILRWFDLGLKYKIKKFKTTFEFKMIDIRDFYKWGEMHQDLIDTRKIKVADFGDEPDWLKEKRKLDKKLPQKHNNLWTEADEKQLIAMYEAGETREAMSEKFNRSLSGIQRKIDRLKALGYLPIEKKGEFYTQAEVIKLLQYKAQGLTNREIGNKLGGRSKASVSHKYNELKAKGLCI